jgi:hypothetical protein
MRSRDLLAITLLVLAAGGCTTDIDDSVVIAISTMVPSLADSDLASQAVEAGGSLEGGTIQNVYFQNVSVLGLTLDEIAHQFFSYIIQWLCSICNPPTVSTCSNVASFNFCNCRVLGHVNIQVDDL